MQIDVQEAKWTGILLTILGMPNRKMMKKEKEVEKHDLHR